MGEILDKSVILFLKHLRGRHNADISILIQGVIARICVFSVRRMLNISGVGVGCLLGSCIGLFYFFFSIIVGSLYSLFSIVVRGLYGLFSIVVRSLYSLFSIIMGGLYSLFSIIICGLYGLSTGNIKLLLYLTAAVVLSVSVKPDALKALVALVVVSVGVVVVFSLS